MIPEGTAVNGESDDRPDPRIYVRVLRHLQAQIEKGILVPGDPAPTITSLCGRFECTRQTVAKALRLLVNDGQLRRYPVLGYYVVGDDPASSDARLQQEKS